MVSTQLYLEVRLTVLGHAVLIRVVAAEENVRLVCAHNTVKPANGSRCRAISEVLLNQLRLVSKSEQVVTSVLGELLSLVQSLLELGAKSGVARVVDGVLSLPLG